MRKCFRLFILLLLMGAGASVVYAQDVTGAWAWYANGFKGELNLKQEGGQIRGWIGLDGANYINDLVTGTISGIEVRFTRTNSQLAQPQQYLGFILRANNPAIDSRMRMTGADAIAGTFSHNGQWASAWYATRTGPYREQPGLPPVACASLGSVWQVAEVSTDGRTTYNATWTRRGTSNTFDGVWPTAGVRDTLTLESVSGTQVVLVRAGNNGRYTGTLSADCRHVTSGTMSWDAGFRWSATFDSGGAQGGSIPSLAGAWASAGRPTSITQDSAGNLMFTNEYGQRSRGRFADAATVVATEWEGGLRGALTDGNKTIRWANGTAWAR